MKLAESGHRAIDAAALELRSGIDALGLTLDEQQQQTLLRYLVLLEKWNRVYNLTAVREPERMVSAHLLDSLAVIPYIRGKRILDVGSGAGLPGIPIAVALPETEVVLLDSNHKRSAFLRQVVAELGIANASVVCERVESWQTEQRFEFVVSRAFAEIAEFVRQSRHLLAAGGLFAAMKGLHPYEEIERLPAEARLREAIELHVPGVRAARCLILIEPTC